MPEVSIVILAAGRSDRFGAADKLTAHMDGIPVIRHVAEAACAAGSRVVVVVTGSPAVRNALGGLPVRFARPGREAMGSSIAAGVAASPDADAWLVWPGDMPLVRTGTARRVLGAFDPDAPVVPVHADRRGHPVLFPSRFRADLEALSEDRGARSVLSAADRIVEVFVDDPGIHFDIDVPEDLLGSAGLPHRFAPRY